MMHRKFLKIVLLTVSGAVLTSISLFSATPYVYQDDGETTEEDESGLTIPSSEDRITDIEGKLIAFEGRLQVALKEENPIASDQSSVSRGKQIFMKKCKNCHGATGQGNGPLAKTIKNAGSLSLQGTGSRSDQQLFDVITEGRKPMPSYGRTIKEDDRWHLVNYMRTFAPKTNEN